MKTLTANRKHRVIATACAACLILSGVPAPAFAAASQATSSVLASLSVATGTLDCQNGWVLTYEVGDDGNATITGVETAGDGEVVIPERTVAENAPITAIGYIDKAHISSTYQYGFTPVASSLTSISIPSTVTLIGNDVFRNCTQLTSIDLPDNLQTIGVACFFNTGLTEITLPATLTAVPLYAFMKCASLESVTFEGKTLDYIGRYAFRSCTSLKSISIPVLSHMPSDSSPDAAYGSTQDKCIGQYAFQGCTALASVEFQASNANMSISGYFENGGNTFTDCDSFKEVVWRGKTTGLTNGMIGGGREFDRTYCTIDFFGSEQDAAANTNRLGQVCYLNTTTIMDILDGTASSDNAYQGESEVPECPEGYVWGLGFSWNSSTETASYSTPLSSLGSKLTSSYVAVPVSIENLDFAFMYSPRFFDATTLRNADNGNLGSNPRFYMDDDTGLCDLSSLKVYASDGTELVEGVDFNFEITRCSLEPDTWKGINSPRLDEYTWTPVSSINSTGYYRIVAVGRGEYSDTSTDTETIIVTDYEQDCSTITGTGATQCNNATLALSAVKQSTDSRSVIVPADNWQYALLGSSIAGLYGGTVIFDDGSASGATSYTAAVTAYNAIASSKVMVLGTYVTKKTDNTQILKGVKVDSGYGCLIDGLTELKGSALNFSNLGLSSTVKTIQQLSLTVYDKIASKWDGEWGRNAILVNPTSSSAVSSIAEYAYKTNSPVFFLNDDGSASDELLAVLTRDDFDSIVAVGSVSDIPESSMGAISQSSGITVTRIESQADDGSLSIVDATIDLPDSGFSSERIVITSSSDEDSVVAGALNALSDNGIVLTVGSLEEAQAVRSYIRGIVETTGRTSIDSIRFVGSFDSSINTIKEYIASIWQGTKQGWIKNDDGTWSYYEENMAVTGWSHGGYTDGRWYYLDANGIMLTGWQKINNKWYYLKSGIMQTGWIKLSSKWYYLKSGAMVTGWQKISGTYYYFNASGVMQTGWLKLSGKWYYLKSGAMVTGWQKISGKYYYFNGSGVMQTGWLKLSGKWYYLKSGVMVTGKVLISGYYYTFYSSGVMYGKAVKA